MSLKRNRLQRSIVLLNRKLAALVRNQYQKPLWLQISAFRREEESLVNRASKRRRERFDQVLTMAGDDRSWMDNRKVVGMRGCTEEFIRGVKYFIEFSRLHPECIHEGLLRCPCSSCCNLKVQSDGDIKLHLMKFGFVDNYKRWILHGEPKIAFRDVQRRPYVATNFINEPEAMNIEEEQSVGMNDMVRNAAGPSFDWTLNSEEEPNHDPARWLRLTFYETNFKAIYKTWSELPEKVIDEWFVEFVREYCCPEQSDDVFFKAFKVMISKRYKDIINKMRVKWIEKKKRPVCMIGGVWNDWLTWWNSPEFKKISNKNKRNRESSNGEACVHTGGSLSLINLLDRMKKIHGEHVDEMDALIAMHTRKGPSGELIWASKKHEKVFRQYKDIVRERAIAAGIIDPNDASNTRVPFEGKDWDDAIMAASEGQRTGRGNIIFGFGRGGRALLNLPTRGTHTSSICQVPGNCSSRSIRELQLETEVDGLKVMMKEMIEKQEKEQQNRELEKERDRQERERERQEQNQWLMQLLMNHQQQRVPWGSQHPQPNQWPPGLIMTGASGSFQHQLQNQWSLGMLSPLPPQQLQQQQMQLLPQPQSGQSSASPNNNGRGGCGSEEGGGSRNGSGGRSRNGSGGGNGCRSDTFAVGVENGSLLEMLTDPNYGRAGSGRGV